MPSGDTDDAATERELRDLVDRLLTRDADAHARALERLAEVGDERVIPHLVEVEMIDSIANDWSEFGFPEVLRDRAPPRYLELPEASWPGVEAALAAIAEPNFDSRYAWVEWETWYSQQDSEPLAGFDDWKLQLYRSFLPPVGRLLDVEPREFDLQDVRWGNCDSSFLAALNGPDFVPGDAVDAAGSGGESERYLEADDRVFGFEFDGQAYAVPRWVLFPHEMLNVELDGVQLSLTFCTLCNAPILYDCRVGDRDLTFGSTGMLLAGNKVMFDEETESLWSQHRGVPIAGEFAEEDDLRLDVLPVTQTDWAEWKDSHPETLALDVDTGYDYDYRFYDGNIGFFRHYWEDESAVQPGVEVADGDLPEKESVYGVTGADPDAVYVFPVETVREKAPVVADLDGRAVVALADETDDVAVYEAPPAPVETAAEDGGDLVDAEGRRWTVTRDALVGDDGDDRLERVAGRHGLWFAFRSQYDDARVVTGEESGE
ncbi:MULTISPECIES: DUF3179 domain-containing (seleno)protein [Halorussus]|uniref:DUF3179 domain-containing (seleno)protein n=1 Tax=Halorussus TaxID=1070314 RepID=UPI000E215A2C|nr:MULTISPECIES: DUF3179 domain-containing (seleno)protein [Halorussus]NHN61652.1 DUF3179 domain-containing protein [Halorussus sp. JP-T4]